MEFENYLNEINGKKVLILGGLGFIGHNLIKFLIDNYNCEIICIDNCINSSPTVLNGYLDKITFLELDAEKLEEYESHIISADYIFNLACIQVAHSADDPLEDLRVNASVNLRLLEYIRKNNISGIKKFVYTSSCSVYGHSSKLPVSEQDNVKPLSHYAATKYLGERYSILYNKLYGIPTTAVRYSNVYGVGQNANNSYCGVLGIFIKQALTGDSLTIIGDGEQTRDYTYISDAVKATILAAIHSESTGETFNIATCKETSVNQLVDIIRLFVNDLSVKQIPERDIDNIRRRLIDIEKINTKLGWAPQVNIIKGIGLTLDWYKKELNII